MSTPPLNRYKKNFLITVKDFFIQFMENGKNVFNILN